MHKFLTILFLFVLTACSRKMMPQIETVVKDSVVEKTVYVHRDSVIVIPGDSVKIHDTIPCKNVVYHKVAMSKTGSIKAVVDINKGMLNVDCKTDSLQNRIEWLEAHANTVRTKTITTTINNPPKRFIPKWCKWLLGISVLYVVARVLIWKYKMPIKL